MPDAVNAGSGISGAASTTPAQHLQSQMNQVGGPLGAVAGWMLNGLAGPLIADAQASAADGATQSYTQASAKAASRITGAKGQVTSPISMLMNAIVQALRGVPVVGATLADIVTDLSGLQDMAVGTKNGIINGWSAGSTGGADMGVYSVFADIKTAVAAGYSTATITSSTTWTKPAGAVNEIVVIAVGGGGNGANGNSGVGAPPPGGLGGGYLAQSFKASAVDSTVAITIGTNGAQTSFGSMLTTTAAQGGIATSFGYSNTTSIPGDGGQGGGTNSGTFINATDGESTPLATGGTAGTSYTTQAQDATSGTAGGAVNTTVTTRCGGAGGGGGGRGGSSLSGAVAFAGGNGGAGGYPGGGGGGGGNKGSGVGTGQPGTGGAGANGVMWLFWK